MAKVADVAALVMQSLESASTMKLQKLLYYCQGWHLAWEGEPLFDEAIEAWANGPVVRDIYNRHRGRFMLSHPWPAEGNPGRLGVHESESVEAVVDMYGDWSARQLALATHRERPWIEARRGLTPGSRGNNEIDLEVMLDFFTGLYSQLVEEE